MIRTRFLALITTVLLIAGCSSKAAEPSAPESPPSSPSSHGTLADCLHAHGVPESAGPAAVLGPPAGVDQAAWDQAMSACSQLAPGPAG
jgi:hypothetical protein